MREGGQRQLRVYSCSRTVQWLPSPSKVMAASPLPALRLFELGIERVECVHAKWVRVQRAESQQNVKDSGHVKARVTSIENYCN